MIKKQKCIACLGERVVGARLCKKCQEFYGPYKIWPAWLKFLQWDITRERIDNKMFSVEKPFTDTDEDIYFDASAGMPVRTKRSTLLEQFDERGYVALRGCREETFALIDGKEPDYV